MLHVQIYVALFGLLYLVLSVRTLRLRRRLRIAVGDGGNPMMLRAMQAHANFAEYVPLTLVIIFMMERVGTFVWVQETLCFVLLGGRICHAWGISHEPEDYRFRVAGMMLTLGVLGVASVRLLWGAMAWNLSR